MDDDRRRPRPHEEPPILGLSWTEVLLVLGLLLLVALVALPRIIETSRAWRF